MLKIAIHLQVQAFKLFTEKINVKYISRTQAAKKLPVELYHKKPTLLGLSFSPAVIVKCFLLNL